MSSSRVQDAMSSSCWDTSRSELMREIEALKRIQFNNRMNERIEILITVQKCCGSLTTSQEQELIENLYPWLK